MASSFKTTRKHKGRSRSASHRTRRRRLGLEHLESRQLLAANLVIHDAYLSNWNGAKIDNPVVGSRVYLTVEYSTTDLPLHCATPDVQTDCNYRIRYKVDGVERSSGPLTLGIGEASATLKVTSSGKASYLTQPPAGTSLPKAQKGAGYWVVGDGLHHVSAELDADNTINSETNEQDNVKFFSFNVVDTFQSGFGESQFQQPIAGIPYVDWTQSYSDVDGNFSGLGTLEGELFNPGVIYPSEDYRGGPYTYDGHDAFDMGPATFAEQDIGIPIYAAATGVVTAAVDGNEDRVQVWCPGIDEGEPHPAPNFVTIAHGNDWETHYFHMRKDSVAVSVGDVVKAGEAIGLVGSSGCSTGSHLHFSTYHQDLPVETYLAPADYWANPWEYRGDVPPSVLDFGLTDHVPLELTGPGGDVIPPSERPAERKIFSTSENIFLWFVPHNFVGATRVVWTDPQGGQIVSNLSSGQWLAINAQSMEGNWQVDIQHQNTAGDPWNVLATDEFFIGDRSRSPAPVIEFNSDLYYITENGKQAVITVKRSGNSGVSTVNYTTLSGSATASDFESSFGTLTFAEGELEKTFTVNILDDDLWANDEALQLVLNSPTGAVLGTQFKAGLFIIDDDALINLTPVNLFVQADTESIHDDVSIMTLGRHLRIEVNGEVCFLSEETLASLVPWDRSTISLTVGAGQDTINLDVSSGTSAGAIKIDTGDADDSVAIRGANGNVVVATGRGDDVVTADVVAVPSRDGGRAPQTFDLSVDLGAGNDQVFVDIDGNVSRTNIAMTGGDGNDEFVTKAGIDPTPFHFVHKIRGGRGNDIVNMNLTSRSRDSIGDVRTAHFDADMGPGDDIVHYYAANVALHDVVSRVRGGQGNDTIQFDWQNVVWHSLDVGRALTDLRGGRGNDLMTVASQGGSIMAGADVHVNMHGAQGDDILRNHWWNFLLDGDMLLKMRGGRGRDAVEADISAHERSRGTLTARLFGGLDDDELSLMVRGLDDALIRALIDGGRGIDTCRAPAVAKVIRCER